MVTIEKKTANQTIAKLPPKSRVPRIIQTIRSVFTPVSFLKATQQEYGDIFLFESKNFSSQIVLSNVQAIQELLTADSKLFESGSGSKIIQPLVGANSLILLDGDRHLQQRKLLMPPFHGERMRAYGQLICNITNQVTSQWTVGQSFLARPNMQDISLQVILRAVFGLKEGERYQQIKQVLTEMLDTFNSPPTVITQLPYLNAVCSETLRIYPVAFFSLPRILKEPMQFMGYDLPKGMMLSVSIYLTHHRPDVYPEPEKFQPERFLERQFSPYEFLPFGGGNRRCIGAAFALFEMKLVLANILSHYSLELMDKAPLKPVRRGIVFAPNGGVHLMVKDKYGTGK